MIQDTIEVESKYRVRVMKHVGPLDWLFNSEQEQYDTEAEAQAALEERIRHDLADLHERGVNVFAEEDSIEDQAIEYRYSEQASTPREILMYQVEISHRGPLYDAEADCEHFLVQNMSGIHCLHCTGWYRSSAER